MSDREKGDELRDRMAARFDGDTDEEPADEAEEGEDDEMAQTAENAKSSKPSKTEREETIADAAGRTSVKDRPSVLMYLPGDLHTDLDVRFDELNARHKRKHGEPLEKNRDYYPLIVELGLEKIAEMDDEDLLGRL